ncbi:hypothetical protein QAD02_008902 [Eretmocerus hayati]|uniref:Uncharacterized protein n=1 Tax=Eretmocerus hayati TaxID=131215 RepID=A0ACC2N7R2_9HYME|nr:hypothetical protein QAD02_008902 [Eretmocerus hayati]
MPTASPRQHLNTVLKRFKFEELEAVSRQVFPEISWPRVKYKLMKHHQQFTTAQALKVINNELDKLKLSDNIITNRVAILEVIDVSKHYKKKVWHGYELRSNDPVQSITADQIENDVSENFQTMQTNVDVRTVLAKGVIFVSIKFKPKKSSSKSPASAPTFFALMDGEKFFFSSKKQVSEDIVLAIVNALGHSNYKQLKLCGRDVHSLVQILINKKTSKLQSVEAQVPEDFEPELPSRTELGYDFTQHKQREEYSKKIFEDDPVLEQLKLNSINQPWEDEEAVNRFPDDIIQASVTFSSPDLSNFLGDLVKLTVIETPVPDFLTNLKSLGRNEFTLKQID